MNLLPKKNNKKRNHAFRFTTMVIFFLGILFFPVPSIHAQDTTSYPRTANYFLQLDRIDVDALSRYDVVILPAETQVVLPQVFSQLRKLNPDIIILAYVPSQSVNSEWNDSLHRTLMQGIDSAWYLRSSAGASIHFPGFERLQILNVTTGWADHISTFVNSRILSTGYWDGVFYDMVDPSISWMNNGDIDINRDGIRDNAQRADALWVNGMQYLLNKTRQLNPNTFVVINGTSYAALQGDVNGRMFENFPTPWHQDGTWNANMRTYIYAHDDPQYEPHLFIVNNNTNNTYDNTNYQRMRYGLTSALLGNGYYSFDSGDQDHGQLWWYDEYDTYLGGPLNGPVDMNDQNSYIEDGVWKREFEFGMVVINASGQRKRIALSEEYEKIHGIQDPYHNDGSIIDRVYLEPYDGIILTKRSEEIIGDSYDNGSFTRVFNQSGLNVKTGFFSYKPSFGTGAQVLFQDIDDDGNLESMQAYNGHITVRSNTGTINTDFYPYGRYYRGGINFVVADLNGDATKEIITGTNNGGGPHVRVFNQQGRALHGGFFPYNENFRGGVNVAVCDLNGDATQEIITGAGFGGGPHVRILSGEGNVINPGFFAYQSDFRGGVDVACGDVNGDGKNEIITAPGRTGGPHIKVFNGQTHELLNEFFAYSARNTEGVTLSVVDIDRDGRDEIIVQTRNYFSL